MYVLKNIIMEAKKIWEETHFGNQQITKEYHDLSLEFGWQIVSS